MLNSDAADPGVAAARREFLEHGRPGAAGVSNLVVASWERSRAAGVDLTEPHSVYDEDVETDSLLTRCGRPVLEQFASDSADLSLTIGVTDRKGRVVQRFDSSPAITRLFDRAQYAPGFDFSEDTMGTNGAGTVIAAGQPVSVVGPEHFSEKLQIFGASGAPLVDPVTGRIEGVLTIALPVRAWNPIVQTLAKSAAKHISRNLLLDRSQSQQAVFDAYLRTTARSARRAVIAFGDSMFIANAAAQQLFDADEQRMLREYATFLLAHRDSASDTVPLPGAQHLVRIRGTRIEGGSGVAGMVVAIDPVAAQPPGSPTALTEPAWPRSGIATPPTAAAAHPAGEHSPAWLRARHELRAALDQTKPALVVGEPGAGKATLVTELFQAAHPDARSIAVDAAQPELEGPPVDLDAPGASPGPTLCLIRHIDRASTEIVERIAAYFAAAESSGGDMWVVATVVESPFSSDLPAGRLLARFEAAVTVPPLRLRTDDLPAITAALLRRIAPDRTVRLSPAAQRLIGRYAWPRNIAQLREVLVDALRLRPVGEIQAADLPGYCQTTSHRTLTPLETAERDAIVTALHEVNSNRVAAAIRLGMSRSSLYRKLKTYGITA